MKPVCVLLLSAFCVGCADIRDTAEDISTVTLGDDFIQPVEIDQSVALTDQPLVACIPIQIDLQENASVSLQPSSAGCALTLRQPELVLFNKKQIDDARAQVGAFDIDGIRAASVELMQIKLRSGDGQALPLDHYADAVTLEVDGAVLLDKIAPDTLQTAPVKRELPSALLAKLKSSIKNGQPAQAEIVLTLWLRGVVIQDVPTSLDITLVLQPELKVSLLKAL